MNYLFVCTYNINRSVAAAKLFRELLKKHKIKANVKDAGISPDAKTKVSKKLVNWADKIYVMEDFHKSIINKIVFGSARKINVLNIKDLYHIHDPVLLELLKKRLEKDIIRLKAK